MSKIPARHTNGIAMLLDALDEQEVEAKLFRSKLSELAGEVGMLSTNLLRYDDALETVAVETDALRAETRKTKRLLARY